MTTALHNHLTRDIKPRGECPACDVYHDADVLRPDAVKGVEGDGSDCTQCASCGFCIDCGDCARLGCGEVFPTQHGGLDRSGDVVNLVPVDTAERLGDGRTVLRPSGSPCRKHGIRRCPKCGS